MTANLKMRFSFNSIHFKLPFVIMVIILPLVLLLIYFSRYSIQVVHDQVAQSNKNMINLYMQQIDTTLLEVEKYMSTVASTDYDYMYLESIDPADYDVAMIRLSNKLSLDVLSYSQIDSLFIYNARNDELIYGFNQGGDFQERQKIQDHIRLLKASVGVGAFGLTTPDWEVHKIHNEYYLFHIVKNGNIYFGAWVNVKRLLIPMSLIHLGESGKAFFVTGDGTPMLVSPTAAEQPVDLAKLNNGYYLSGDKEKFLVVGGPSSQGSFSLAALIPEESILENLPFLRRLVMLILYGSLILLPTGFVLLRRTFLLPLNRILAAMRKTRDGLIEYRISKFRTSDEFQNINDAFNQMMSQIQKLRIDVYEEQLSNQRTELKLLQLQLNPHFLMNSLNIIHGLAFMKRFELIQEMSISLVQYFRYMLRSNTTFVPLKDELQHVRNYLRIQELRYQEHLTFHTQAPDAFMSFEVPPLIIQTFVENTVKHAVTMEEPMHITVESEFLQEPESCLKITLTDTGAGFPEKVLDILNKGEQLQDESGEHIGIWNVQRRLKLLYGGKAGLEFSNRSTGACVEIWLPLRE
ncbi:cache domain-containing sensor histidine kinase [Paenibacillus periandrae]|uniref:cache domain-containing sensor histidine kinase n=1 Tax=Paenibacillus periandrae TaxID=1761741 RepID=UPI001F09CAFE|nr:sensor histidine kinase [Paenibacillus periandrae]